VIMVWRLFRVLNPRRTVLALASALAAMALFAPPAPSAFASTPLTVETLSGTGTTSNGNVFCTPAGSRSVAGAFSVSGSTAIGSPYPGTFTESGNFYASGQRNPPYIIRFHASFTIISDTTKITGYVNAPWPTGTFYQICYGNLSFSSSRITYSAVINGQTYSGTVAVSASFTIGTDGRASLSESFS
jgi:hypothetical protein